MTPGGEGAALDRAPLMEGDAPGAPSPGPPPHKPSVRHFQGTPRPTCSQPAPFAGTPKALADNDAARVEAIYLKPSLLLRGDQLGDPGQAPLPTRTEDSAGAGPALRLGRGTACPVVLAELPLAAFACPCAERSAGRGRGAISSALGVSLPVDSAVSFQNGLLVDTKERCSGPLVRVQSSK